MNHRSDTDFQNEGNNSKVGRNQAQLSKCMRAKNRIPKGKPKLEEAKRKQG